MGKLSDRWHKTDIERAASIVNDIAEEIDNRETRAELRQALAIYADLLYDEVQKRTLALADILEVTGKHLDK